MTQPADTSDASIHSTDTTSSDDARTPSEPTIIAIDNGSQSIRVLQFNLKGELLHRSHVAIDPYYSQQDGWAEQDPDYYWAQLVMAFARLWSQGGDKHSVVGLTVTTQRASMVFLDANGEPVRPTFTWMDQRRQTTLDTMPLHWRTLIALGGKSGVLKRVRQCAPSNWVSSNQPDVWAKTEHYVQLSCYLNYRLTGQMVDSRASQVGYVPFNYKTRDWVGESSWHWSAYNVRPSHMPTLVDPGEPIGALASDAAHTLGLPEGLPVIAAGADKACEMSGAGIADNQTACLSYGTRATISTLDERYIEPSSNMPAYPTLSGHHYMSEIAVSRGFWMVSWFKEQFASYEQQQAAAMHVPVEQLFDNLVNQVPAGSLGLMLQPFWGTDSASQNPQAKGAILGFGEAHTRAHMYRSILEGLIYALREGKETLEKRSRTRIERLRVSGGGSQSDAAMQITADVFGLPAERPHTFETSGLGAAMIAAVGLGYYKNLSHALEHMSRQGDVFTPNEDTHALYDALYKRVYKNMYKQLNPLYSAIRDITGYPK